MNNIVITGIMIKKFKHIQAELTLVNIRISKKMINKTLMGLSAP